MDESLIKIKIKLVDNLITVENSNQLRSYQKHQLVHYKLKEMQKGHVGKFGKPDEKILKIISYFDREKINYTISHDVKIIIDRLKQKEKNFSIIIKKAQALKNGNYRDESTKVFDKFLMENDIRPLKKHQKKAAEHLFLVKNGANFSVPGSGKTAVVLSVYEKLKSEKKVNTLFVVGPTSCFQPWISEFKETLNRKPKYRISAGGNPIQRKSKYYSNIADSPELYLISFQTLLQDVEEVRTFLQRRGIEIFFVIDEAHYIKRIDGNWAKAVLKLSKYANYRCVLTGTPMPQSFTDLFNLFDFLWPETKVLDDKTKIKVENFEKQSKNFEAKKILKNKIDPLFYRVKKEDLGLKPATFHKPTLLKMNNYEQKIYDAIENRIIKFTKEDCVRNVNVVSKLRKARVMRLRQVTSYSRLLLNAIEGYEEDLIGKNADIIEVLKNYDSLEKPAKLEFLISFLKDANNRNEKVLVWSNFIGTIKCIEKSLTNLGLNCEKIYGNTPIEESSIGEEKTREKIRQEFLDQDSNLNILIANPAAIAESISLHTTCHKAVYYDLSYNCAQYLQSLDRIHRVGGSEKADVHYYFLQYKETIDKDILENLKIKAEKMEKVISEDLNVVSLDMTDESYGNYSDDELAIKRLFENKNAKN